MGMVVATPLIVVTTSVVNVRMEREKEVDRVGETEGSVEMEVGVEADEEVPAGVDEVVGELEFVVGGMDAEVVGRKIGEVLNVEAVMDELSANCCLRSTSLLACISTGSATTSHIDTNTDKMTTPTENSVLILATKESQLLTSSRYCPETF